LEGLAELVVVVARLAQGADRLVVDDAVEPGSGLGDLDPARQGLPGRDQRLLERVLGPGLGEEESLAVAQQGLPVALHQGLERALVAGAREHEEAGVGLRGEQATGKDWAHDGRGRRG
jgi:hypothetical protein